MKLDRVFGVAACLIVALGLILAFLVIGPPSHARLVALDQKRATDLYEIASALHDRYGGTTDALPKRLPSDVQGYDPVTRRAYEYQKVDARNYTLCARFALPAENDTISSQWPLPQRWPHRAGPTCYRFNVAASRVAPTVIRQ